jgi:hypothetical protein
MCAIRSQPGDGRAEADVRAVRGGGFRGQILTRAREMDAKMVKVEQRKERKAAEKLSAQVAALQAEVAEKEKEARASKLELKVRYVVRPFVRSLFAASCASVPPSLAVTATMLTTTSSRQRGGFTSLTSFSLPLYYGPRQT